MQSLHAAYQNSGGKLCERRRANIFFLFYPTKYKIILVVLHWIRNEDKSQKVVYLKTYLRNMIFFAIGILVYVIDCKTQNFCS